MRIRSILLVAVVVLLAGCMNAARSSAPESDCVYRYEITHAKTKAVAYQAVELWIAESFVSEKAVVDLKQPETGTIIAKPVIDWWAGGEGIGAHLHSPYVMKIVSADKTTTMNITLLAGKNQFGDTVYPPEEGMPKIRARFEGFRDGLSIALKQ